MTVKFQKAYVETERPTVDTGQGLTEQTHKRQCDMNYILRDYRKSGLVKHMAKNRGRYDDVKVEDFQQAMFIVNEAQQMFQGLPGEIRKKFDNKPEGFLAFVQDEGNIEEMKKMGIMKGVDGIDIEGTINAAVAKAHEKALEKDPERTS